MNRIAPLALLAALAVPLLAGCLQSDPRTLAELGFQAPADLTGPLDAADLDWPDFTGETLRILDHGAFWAFDDAAARFQGLTGATVVHTAADDAGTALNLATRDRGDPEHDILYGIDNLLLHKALTDDVLRPYTPALAARVDPDVLFFDIQDWPATPVDHGYIALNIDAAHPGLADRNVTIDDLLDVRDNADRFVTPDPRTSTPGLGFLLITLGAFGEDTLYDWQDYWTELFGNGVRITSGWTEAYETYYTGGYGIWEPGHLGGRPIVTSYTESPAYEWYWDQLYPAATGDYEPGGHYGGDPAALPQVLLTHGAKPAAFHQVQTMAILRGTPHLALAQAWIEFTLTDDFQALAAPQSAVYPVVSTVSVAGTYGGVDPAPGSFATTDLDWRTLGADLERWVSEWTDLCEAHACA